MNSWHNQSEFDQRLGSAVINAVAWFKRNASPRGILRLLAHPAMIGCAYLAIGFVTFGHVAAANYRADQAEYAKCDHVRALADADTSKYITVENACPQPEAVNDAALGVTAGAFWPLYLSWEAQQ